MPYFEPVKIKPDDRKLIISVDRNSCDVEDGYSVADVYADYLRQRGHDVTIGSGNNNVSDSCYYADNPDEDCDEDRFLWVDFCDSSLLRAYDDFIKSLGDRIDDYTAREQYDLFKNSIYATHEYIYADHYAFMLERESVDNDEFFADVSQMILRLDNYERHVCENCYNRHPCDCDRQSEYLDRVETSDC